MGIQQVDLVANVPYRLAFKRDDMVCDFDVQNTSANAVYLKSTDDVALTGILLAAVTGTYSDDKSDENLWLIAGVNSTVFIRVNYRFRWEQA